MRTALRGDDPAFFFEHRALLDSAQARRPYPGDEYCLPFGQATWLMEGNRLTVVTWGAMVYRCLAASDPFRGQVTLLDLRTILPWDSHAVLESVSQTGKLLVDHEDTITVGFAAEIIATVAGRAFAELDAPLTRIATPDVPIPFNRGMMEAVIPDEASIRAKISELLAY